MAREHNPPMTSTEVFCWVQDTESNQYMHEQVSKKWQVDTLGNYSAKQCCYDLLANKWDCSSEFGSNRSEGDDSEDKTLYVDFDQANKVCNTTVPLETTNLESPLDPLEDNEEWLPFSLPPHETKSTTNSVLDTLEEEIMDAATIYFGYLPPLPTPLMPALSEESSQKHFLRLLGFSWSEFFPNLFNHPHVLTLAKFLKRMSCQAAILSNEWDLAQEN